MSGLRNSSRDIPNGRCRRTDQPCKEGWTDRDEERMSEEILNQPVCGCGSVQWKLVKGMRGKEDNESLDEEIRANLR